MLFAREAHKEIISLNEYCNSFRDLNPWQRRIIMYNHSWCQSAIYNLRNGKMIDGFTIFLSGLGRTGKSHVIILICRDVIYFFHQTLKPKPSEPLVLLTTPTGSATFNIGGTTLHSAFMLNLSDNDNIGWENILQCTKS